MDLEQIKKYLREENLSLKNNVSYKLQIMKEAAIKNQDEPLANELWCMQEIYAVQKLYLKAFELLKRGSYREAWNDLESIDIRISHIHYNFESYCDDYHIPLIKENIEKYQKVYPYRLFISREEIIKHEECSICGKPISIRNPCEHELGKVYMGELCQWIVTDMELAALAVVTNPMDKSSVLFPKGYDYDYSNLDRIMKKIESPYQRFELVEYKLKRQ